MAHKTLIGGTAYEISGGKTLVDGTAYSIKNGKTLVDGAAYEVGFTSFEVVVDLGTFTTTSNPFMGNFADIALTPFPDGYKDCTHALLDGALYTVTPKNFTTTVFGYVLDGTTYEVRFNISGSSAIVAQFAEGTHSLQLGIYE